MRTPQARFLGADHLTEIVGGRSLSNVNGSCVLALDGYGRPKPTGDVGDNETRQRTSVDDAQAGGCWASSAKNATPGPTELPTGPNEDPHAMRWISLPRPRAGGRTPPTSSPEVRGVRGRRRPRTEGTSGAAVPRTVPAAAGRPRRARVER